MIDAKDALQPNPPEAVFHCSSKKYTNSELENIYQWTDQSVPGWHLNGRGGSLFIENPPIDICETSTWQHHLDTAVRPEWQSLHPLLQRSNIVVRFVDRLYDLDESIEVGGDMRWIKKGDRKLYIVRLSLFPKGEKIDVDNLLFKLIHELTEEDFWQKTTPIEKQELHEIDASDAKLLSQDNYPLLLDESIANRRTVRALRRIWPNLNGKGLYGDPVDKVA